MEPRFFKRGNAVGVLVRRIFHQRASMEPRFFKRGNGERPHDQSDRQSRFNGTTFFQTWKSCERLACSGRPCSFNGTTFFQTWKYTGDFVTVEIDNIASMEPRFFKRGNRINLWKNTTFTKASMEPRFFKRGNSSLRPVYPRRPETASMEPRFFKRGNNLTLIELLGNR